MGKKRTKAKLEKALIQAHSKLLEQRVRGFDGGKVSRRTENWWTNNKGPNSDIRQALQRLIARHQDMVDSDPWADKAIRVICNNWIGDGIIGEPANKNKKYSQIWNDWAGSIECDFYRKTNFYGLQNLIARTIAVRGSCVIRRRIDERLIAMGLPPLVLQVLEPDWLDISKDNGSDIVFGKQFDTDGRLEGYWIRRNHPGESDWRNANYGSDFVPFDEICHAYEVRRPHQATGVPWGASSLLTLRDIGDHSETRLMLDKIACCFVGFITDPDPETVSAGMDLLEKMEPGALEILPPGKDIKFNNPPAAGNFIELQRHHLHAVAAGYGITFEALTGILSEVNFANGRMGWLEFHRNVASWRWNITVPQVLDPVAQWFSTAVAMANMATRVSGRMIWTPPRREMMDPSREIPGLIDSIRAGMMSLSEVQRSLGYVPQQVLDELSQDINYARGKDLALTVDAKLVSNSGVTQARPSGSELPATD